MGANDWSLSPKPPEFSARVGTRNSRQKGKTKDDDNVLHSDQYIAPHSTEVQEWKKMLMDSSQAFIF